MVANREFWAKVCVKGEDGLPDYAATKEQLKLYIALIKNDQERVLECLLAIFADCPLMAHVRKPDLQTQVCMRLEPRNMASWDDLRERTAEVIANAVKEDGSKQFPIDRRTGVSNPFYIEPAPDSRARAAAGNARG